MFCRNCGKNVADDARFCKFCGTGLSDYPTDTPTADASQEQTEAQVPTQETPIHNAPATEFPPDFLNPQGNGDLPYPNPVLPPKKKSKKWLIPLIAIILAAAIAVAVLIPNFSSSPSDKSAGTNDTAKEKTTETADSQKPATAPSDMSRTIMVYVVGSDLESRYGAASLDIQEMLDAELDDSKTQLVLCAGGASDWDNNIISDSETSYYQVTDDDITKVSQQFKKNMGKSSTLSDFMEWTVSNYPAESYGLILWNHGGGPMLGFGSDELSNDYLTIEEIVKAFKNSPFSSTDKLEFLGFDACIMGSVETAWMLKDYAEYYIASQEVEPGFGWDYGFLSSLSYCDNGSDIGKEIIDSYIDYYEELFKSYPREETEITLSCIDLSKIGEVETAIDNLFSVVNQDVVTGKFATASRCRKNTKAFGKVGANSVYDLVDLKHIASLLSSTYSEASELEKAVDNAVVYTGSNIRNANGLSIYHPYENKEDFSYFSKTYKSFGFADKYSDYIVNFMSHIRSDNEYSINYRGFSKTQGSATANGQESDLEIQLTAEQMKTFSKAKYYVFYEMDSADTFSGETEYLQVFSGQDVNASDDGKLTATYKGKAVFGKDNTTGEYSPHPLTMNQIYDGSQNEKYYFTCMFQHFGDAENFEMKLQNVNWFVKIKDGVATLLNAYPMEQDPQNNFPEKMSANPEDYSVYVFAGNAYNVTQDSNQNTVFEFTGSSYGWEFLKDNGFTVEMRPIENKAKYKAVFLIEDIYGNTYFSDFIPLG